MEILDLYKVAKCIINVIVVSVLFLIYFSTIPVYGQKLMVDEEIDIISDYIDISEQIIQSGGFPQSNTYENDYNTYVYNSPDGEGYAELIEAYNKVAMSILSWDGLSSEIVIDVSSFGIEVNQCKSFVTTAVNLHPECFTFSGKYKYSTNSSITIKNLYLVMDTSYDKEDIKTFNSTVDKIVSSADPAWTTLQKIIYIHDYLVTHIDYDKTLSKFNAYNAIVEGDVVCQGYSLAYVYLLNKLEPNCDCQIVTSKTINHAWNLVMLNGEQYYIDATWDDPTNEYKLYNSYKNFMVSQDKLHANHESDDWVNAYGESIYGKLNTSSAYDSAPWMDMHSEMPMFGKTGIYYKGYSPIQLLMYDFEKEQSTEIVSYNDVWKVWNKNAVLTASYSSLMRYGDYVIVTLPQRILAVDMSGKTVKTYDSLSDQGYIYGARVTGNTVEYDIYTYPQPANGTYIGRFTQIIDSLPIVKYRKGDLTGDGDIAMSDVVKLARAVAGSATLTEEEKFAGDLTGDGEVAMGDVVKLARFVSGTITSL